ncbi:MAG: nucleotide exchange factor GrpE [Alphaproteobacteria bacterium]|nr:nucleotide exchange factor GrpE [Alphaproteobacteria bacterium]
MEDKKEVKVETVSVKDAKTPEKPVEKTEKKDEAAELVAQIAELNDKYLRTAAELENTRRRAAIDADARARSRAMSVAEKILPVMDAIHAALKHSPNDAGIQSMSRAMESAFEQIGITKIKSVGETLNPALHNAIQVVAAADGVASNTVVEEMQAGYMFGDNVLRTAMVVVAK